MFLPVTYRGLEAGDTTASSLYIPPHTPPYTTLYAGGYSSGGLDISSQSDFELALEKVAGTGQ